MSHNERCKECKVRVRQFLEKIYGPVIPNHRINLNTRPEELQDHPRYKILNEIYKDLQKHRGFTDFVRASYVDVDFFLPNQNMIVEFDESQHFTEPRKISLSHFPPDLKIGFRPDTWMSRCNEIHAKDNDPPFRDEQRAWYDTLRDFLPETKGLNPTVRLYAKDKTWCSLNPENLDDLDEFKKNFKYVTSMKENWIATVTIETKIGNDPQFNFQRCEEMKQIITKTGDYVKGDGIILFPAGFFNTGVDRTGLDFYEKIASEIKNLLKQFKGHVVIVVGIDGFQDQQKNDRDQIAIAFDKNAILSIARKHFPTDEDIKFHLVKSEFFASEHGKSRFFTLNNTRYYIAVCYDVNAGHQQKMKKENDFDIILNPIHKFEKGDSISYYVRKGMGLESSYWQCPVFGSVKFINNYTVTEGWRSGIFWSFPSGISTSTPGTTIEKIAIPGNRAIKWNVTTGDQVIVEIFTDITKNCEILQTNTNLSLADLSEIKFKSNYSSKPTMQQNSDNENAELFQKVYRNFSSKIQSIPGLVKIQKRNEQCTFSFIDWKEKLSGTNLRIQYEFDHFVSTHQISVEFQCKTDKCLPLFNRIIEFVSEIQKKMPGNAKLTINHKSDWHRIQFIYDDFTDPALLSEALQILIDETHGEVSSWIEDLN